MKTQQCYKLSNNSIFRTVIIVALRVSKPNPSQQFSFWASKISPQGWRKRCPELFPNARIAWRWNFHQTRPKNPFHSAPNSSTDARLFSWGFSDDLKINDNSFSYIIIIIKKFFNCQSNCKSHFLFYAEFPLKASFYFLLFILFDFRLFNIL